MLLRDAQEEARIVHAAMRGAVANDGDPQVSHVAEAAALLEILKGTDRSRWTDVIEDRTKAVGLILLTGLGLANEFEVDGSEALKSVLLEESP